MADDINTLTARKMRQAMKNIGDKDEVPSDSPLGDHVEIRSPLSGAPGDPVRLTILRGGESGEVVASVDVTPGVLKRLKRELYWFKQAKSGAMLAFRHGNRP